MPSRLTGWNERRAKSQTERIADLKQMSQEEIIKWAIREVEKAHERESVRACMVARLDDLLRAHCNRITDIESQRGNAASPRVAHAIAYLVKQWADITGSNPRTIMLSNRVECE